MTPGAALRKDRTVGNSWLTARPPVAAFALTLAGLSSWPAWGEAERTTVELDSGWRFKVAQRLTGVESPTFDDSNWPRVDVPHTWNRIGGAGIARSPDTNTTQGTGWYRLRFKAPSLPPDSRCFLQFDGVGAIADVWLNGHHLGEHKGAFSRFRFDATAAIEPRGENLLVVKADNSRPEPGSSTQDVVPLGGDFFVFGGIYRDVSLIVTRSAHVDLLDFGGPGLYARAVRIAPDSATVDVVARLANDAARPQRILAEAQIEDASGTPVASAPRRAMVIRAKEGLTFEAALRVGHPRLWRGRQDPYLYRVAMTLRAPGGAVLDRVVQPLGLRTIAFDADKGFFLNGEHLLLKGVSLHQDRPGKGWAISRADQQQDFDIIADMGANAVRLAHYQHDQVSYALADATGFAIWAEVPVVNGVSFDGSPANATLTGNATQQLTELIRQNYNHPSIVVWSIGNEVDLTATKTRGPSKPAALLQSLNDLARREDPSRPTTLADCCEVENVASGNNTGVPHAPREVIVGLTETIGYNRYYGWYYGHVQDFGPFLDRAHLRHPSLPMAVSEYGAGAGLTQHSDDPLGGLINPHGRPHPEELQSYYHEQSWMQLRSRAYLWGEFIWNMFDFASTNRDEGDLTDINEKGLVSYDRAVRKDAFYFYRANWNSSPTLHLTERRYIDRAYSVIDVKAYSNATQAALQVNGRHIGVTPCTDGICRWHAVSLDPGRNGVVATATIGGADLSDSVEWTFAGARDIVRIKCGDISGYVTPEGIRYGSDLYFVGGDGLGINPPDTKQTDRRSAVAGDPGLYDSYREGAVSYRVPVPNGRYRITAHFLEPEATSSGERVFDVRANGVTVLKDFDVFAAAGGRLKAVDRTFEAPTSNGMIVLDFLPRNGKAVVSALSITPQ
jgi:beta-galactosidase